MWLQIKYFKINKEKTWPLKSSRNIEKIIKFKFAPNKRISIAIIIVITFFLLRAIPHKPTTNINVEKDK